PVTGQPSRHVERAATPPDIDAPGDIRLVEPAGQRLDLAEPLDPHRLAALARRFTGAERRQPGERIGAAAGAQHIKLADRHRRVAADDLVAAVEDRAIGRRLDLRLGGAERAGARADAEALLHAESLRIRAATESE